MGYVIDFLDGSISSRNFARDWRRWRLVKDNGGLVLRDGLCQCHLRHGTWHVEWLTPGSTLFPNPDLHNLVGIPDPGNFPMKQLPIITTPNLLAEVLLQGALQLSEWAELQDMPITVHTTYACVVCKEYTQNVGKAQRYGHLQELEYGVPQNQL
ncbi:hypothetical protein FRC08_004078 [Ceratobasidium sp. 394]|nr:hypothetical protein FRC08_004078 [Ceratobasidium sp. 394]